MHRAANEIEQYKRQIETQAHNMVVLFVIGLILGVAVGAIGINYVNCFYIP